MSILLNQIPLQIFAPVASLGEASGMDAAVIFSQNIIAGNRMLYPAKKNNLIKNSGKKD